MYLYTLPVTSSDLSDISTLVINFPKKYKIARLLETWYPGKVNIYITQDIAVDALH